MGFKELTDEQWESIKTLLPQPRGRGRKRVDDRKVINGILYVLTTGCRWMDMPEKYGSYKTAWRRYKELREFGIWERLVQELQNKGYGELGGGF